MTPRVVTRRFRPLLRVNEWSALELEREMAAGRQALREIEGEQARVEQQLGHWHGQLQAGLSGARAFARCGYAQASEQIAGWMQAGRDVAHRRAAEQERLQRLGLRLAELKRKRTVIERRRDEAVRQHEAQAVNRLAAEHEDLWLSRRTG